MADIAPKLIELSADKLRALHERLDKSGATPEVLEVHHLAINEMLRRGLEAPENDVWDEFEILVDKSEQVFLRRVDTHDRQRQWLPRQLGLHLLHVL